MVTLINRQLKTAGIAKQFGETVLDPFAGSNTTGMVAESLGRKWIAIEKDQQYADDSALRFNGVPAESASGQATLF